MSTVRRANRRCAGSRRGGHGRGRDFACGAPVRCARECAGETDAQPLGVQPVKLRTQRWAQLLAFMLALVCSASLVLHGSQRLQADHLDLAGPSGRSAIRVDIAATAQCLASNKLLRPSPMDAIGPMGMDYMLVVHNPVVPAVQNGAFVVVQQCDSGASTADNVVLSAEQWRALNALAVHRIDNWHIGGTNAAAVRPIQFVPAAAAAATAAAANDAGVAAVAVNSDLDACAGVPAGEAMPDLLGVSAGCGLVGCRKPGSLMTLRYTHNPSGLRLAEALQRGRWWRKRPTADPPLHWGGRRGSAGRFLLLPPQAQPQQLESLPWPQERASAYAQDRDGLLSSGR